MAKTLRWSLTIAAAIAVASCGAGGNKGDGTGNTPDTTPLPTPTPTPPPSPSPSPAAYVEPATVGRLLTAVSYDLDGLPGLVQQYSAADRDYIAECAKRIYTERIMLVGREVQIQDTIDAKMREINPNGTGSRGGMSENAGMAMDAGILSIAFSNPDGLTADRNYQLKKMASDALRIYAPIAKEQLGIDVYALMDSLRPMSEQLYTSVVARTCQRS